MSADAEHVVNVKYDWLAIRHQRVHSKPTPCFFFFFFGLIGWRALMLDVWELEDINHERSTKLGMAEPMDSGSSL